MKGKKKSKGGIPLILRAGFLGTLLRYADNQLSWPDVLRWRGSVLLASFIPVIGMSLFTFGIYVAYDKLELAISIPLSVLGSVSVALGLLLAFRVNTAYDQYTNGRRLIQTVTATIRNLSRQIWISVPEKTQEDHVKKMRCIKLLLAFFVATKHHLRHEYGIDHDDLQELLPKDWIPVSESHGAKCRVTKESSHLISKLGGQKKKGKRKMHDIKTLPLVVSIHDTVKPNEISGFLEPDVRNDVHNVRRSLIREYFPDSEVADSTAPAIQRQAERLALQEELQHQRPSTSSATAFENQPLLQSPSSTATYSSSATPLTPEELGNRTPFISDEDLDQSDGDISLPLEILYQIAIDINSAKSAGDIESSFVSIITNSLDTLGNTLTAFERIVHTPIPKAYNIHLKQGVMLYIFFLPFSLVEPLGIMVIPFVALVSFTLFGILAIGNEIENPFGYDHNDLPLNRYCDELKREVEYVIYHVPSHSHSILLDGE